MNNYNYMNKDLYNAYEKIGVLLNIQETDNAKFQAIYLWTAQAMELSIKEKFTRLAPQRGEIWTVNLGANVGSEMDKIRPFVIVSYKDFNEKSNLVTGIPVTHSEQDFVTQIPILEEFLSYKEGSIDGTAKAEQIRTISKARLGRKIASLNEAGMEKINSAIQYHLGIIPIQLNEDGLFDQNSK